MNVGHAYAVLAGHRTGDRAEAKKFLQSLFIEERRARNRNEAKSRRLRPSYKLGEKIRYGFN